MTHNRQNFNRSSLNLGDRIRSDAGNLYTVVRPGTPGRTVLHIHPADHFIGTEAEFNAAGYSGRICRTIVAVRPVPA